MGISLSGYKLRKDAAKLVQAELDEHEVSEPAGAISVAQLKTYVDHGLVEPASDGRWSSGAVEQLARAHALGHPKLDPHARSLERRVLLRIAENTKAIAPEVLKRALLAVLPTIPEAARKMKRVDTLIKHWHTREADSDRDGRPASTTSGRQTPPRHSWVPLVADTPEDLLFNAAEMQLIYYGHNLAYLEAELGPPTPNAPRVSEIKTEERLALLTVRELARRRDTRATEGLRSRDDVFG